MAKKHKSPKSKGEVALVIAGAVSFGSRQPITLASIVPIEKVITAEPKPKSTAGKKKLP